MFGKRFSGWLLAGTLIAATPVLSVQALADVKAGGVTFPETFTVDGNTLHLNGVGVRTFYHLVDGYATALYLPNPVHTAEGIENAPNPKVIYSVFLHDASAERMRSEYDSIHAEYCAHTTCNAPQEESYKKFLTYLAAAPAHSTQTIVVNDSGVLLLRNNQQIASIADPLFGKGLILSLVGPASPTEHYRKAIIGGDTIE